MAKKSTAPAKAKAPAKPKKEAPPVKRPRGRPRKDAAVAAAPPTPKVTPGDPRIRYRKVSEAEVVRAYMKALKAFAIPTVTASEVSAGFELNPKKRGEGRTGIEVLVTVVAYREDMRREHPDTAGRDLSVVSRMY